MLKNIWYCIKKTSEWYFALLVLYIILTLVNATIPILSAFLPKLVIEKLTLGSDIKGLIGTIMAVSYTHLDVYKRQGIYGRFLS